MGRPQQGWRREGGGRRGRRVGEKGGGKGRGEREKRKNEGRGERRRGREGGRRSCDDRERGCKQEAEVAVSVC